LDCLDFGIRKSEIVTKTTKTQFLCHPWIIDKNSLLKVKSFRRKKKEIPAETEFPANNLLHELNEV